MCKIVGDMKEHEIVQPPPGHSGTRARGAAEEVQMWNLKCYITKYVVSGFSMTCPRGDTAEL